MGKVILWSGISVDGFIAGPNEDISWHRVDEELHLYMNEELGRMGAFLSGRVSHELLAEFWPTADQDPSNDEPWLEFARIWRDMPKFVYSRTLSSADWNTTVVGRVDPGEVEALKERFEGDLVLGGADLAATFVKQGLIDEYRLFVHPVAIGRGKPLFKADAHVDLRLVETKTFGNGVVMLRYEPAGPA